MKKAFTSIWPYLFILVLGVVLVITEYDYLTRLEELNLFFHTPKFFRQCMVVSGGLLSWAGAFLTQLLHYPALGVAVLCLLWALLVALLRTTFHIPSRWTVVALIPVVMLLIAQVDLGYWIYYLKLKGHFFVATLGFLVVVTLVWIYRLLPKYLRTLFAVIAVACGYPFFGAYALLAGVLMAVIAWRIRGYAKGFAAADTLLTALAVVFVPLLCYRHVFHQTSIEYIYQTALPVFSMRQDNFLTYYLPYVIAACTLLVLAITYHPECKNPDSSVLKNPDSSAHKKDDSSAHKNPEGKTSHTLSIASKRERMKSMCLQGGGLVVLAVILALCWYKDGNFHHEITMRKCVDRQDWNGVLQVAKDAKGEPTRDMWMMKNLALTRLGRLGDEMYDYPNGAKAARCPFPTRMVQWDGKMLYLQYGIPNYCYRWCMEDGVEYGWSVDKLKLMVKCSIVNAEWAAAQKYISMLKKTLFHKDWALRYERFVHNPRLVADDAELLAVVLIMTNDNYLSGDNAAVERFLIEHFASSESNNPRVQEQALVAAMMTRNPDLFWMRFYQYSEQHRTAPMPVLFQQAACLFGGLSDKVDVSQMPFDPQVMESCRAFMDDLKRYRDQGMDMERIKPLMRDRYSSTYYFDYFFNHYQEEVY